MVAFFVPLQPTSNHTQVREAAAAAAAVHGCGPRASPLVCGYTREHAALEDALAALKGTETALLFPTGYAANMAVLGTRGSARARTSARAPCIFDAWRGVATHAFVLSLLEPRFGVRYDQLSARYACSPDPP
eukprot:6201903-Pleurochrysis_carterae.AAC.1